MSDTLTLPVAKPRVNIYPETLKKLKVQEEKQVIIHVNISAEPYCAIRIWQSTFLIPKGSSKHCKLIHSENIGIYPDWVNLGQSGKGNFTLIFEGLPSDCTVFDLVEVIPEPNGFIVKDITRNDLDVYQVNI
jgi:hypothetical protein